MSTQGGREVELKRLLVGPGAAERLAIALGGARSTARRQVNHVLDTEDLALRRARYALRLREETGGASLTAKGPGRRVGESTESRPEAEIALDGRSAAGILAGRMDPVELLRLGTDRRLFEDL